MSWTGLKLLVCIGCDVLLCLVVCLTLLAPSSFLLSSLIKTCLSVCVCECVCVCVCVFLVPNMCEIVLSAILQYWPLIICLLFETKLVHIIYMYIDGRVPVDTHIQTVHTCTYMYIHTVVVQCCIDVVDTDCNTAPVATVSSVMTTHLAVFIATQ